MCFIFQEPFDTLDLLKTPPRKKKQRVSTQVCDEDESSLHLNMTLSEPSGASTAMHINSSSAVLEDTIQDLEQPYQTRKDQLRKVNFY